MRALLDVNVLTALFDPDHIFHSKAHSWWSNNAENGWASCPLTENGLIRILAQPAYSAVTRFIPSRIASQLRDFANQSNHEFWPDDLSLRESEHFQLEGFHSGRQITDLYLLALAARRGGRLVTFDGRIPFSAIPRARASNLIVLS